MKLKGFKVVAIIFLSCLVSCVRLSTVVPENFDLTGKWVIDKSLSDEAPDSRRIRREEDRNIARGRQKDVNASASFVVHDFPVVGSNEMFIEQNADSMGIRYSSGFYRDISWGAHDRNYWQVQAGWLDGTLHILSRRKGTEGQEIYILESDSKLTVDVKVDTGGSDVRVKRVFRRQ